jgi:hypothetical protein
MVGVVDYAGLFPPADLDMATAVRNYGAYRSGEFQRFLGRFVVPATRLEEFAAAAEPLMPRRRSDEPWRLAALLSPDLDADRRAVTAFNNRYGSGTTPRAVVDSIEAKLATAAEVAPLIEGGGGGAPKMEVYAEVSSAPDPAVMLAELARRGAKAKIRTGGITPEAIPRSADVVRFIAAASRANVPFKATAGLHHAMRGVYPLTYSANSPRAPMHGFINLFIAASLLRVGVADTEALAALDETDAAAFQFGPASVRWKQRRLPIEQIRSTRDQFARSFGSCSFEEPLRDLQALRLL